MSEEDTRNRLVTRTFLVAGAFWILLSVVAFAAYYSGSAPFSGLGIPVSQLALGVALLWVGGRRARANR